MEIAKPIDENGLLVVNSRAYPQYLDHLQKLLTKEWGEFDFFKGSTKELIVPHPLLAIYDDNLIGGLAFSRYPFPNSEEIGLWINGLLVIPKYRGMGIASKLIKASEKEAKLAKANELLALTNVPKLYQDIGWQVFKAIDKNKIVYKYL